MGTPPIIRLEEHNPPTPISIDEWLDDWILSTDIRIRDLIHEVASKNVAHTDPLAGPTMDAVKTAHSWTALGAGAEEEGRSFTMIEAAIVGIGEYVAHKARELIVAV